MEETSIGVGMGGIKVLCALRNQESLRLTERAMGPREKPTLSLASSSTLVEAVGTAEKT